MRGGEPHLVIEAPFFVRSSMMRSTTADVAEVAGVNAVLDRRGGRRLIGSESRIRDGTRY
jgi:hypothetical protein